MSVANNDILQPDDPVDLHMHTRASDGGWTPETLTAYLSEHRFKVVALADHDSMDSVPEMMERGADLGMRVVPGVEMTTRWEERQVHCLIYGLDTASPAAAGFMQLLQRQQESLAAMSEHIIRLLEQHGRRMPSLDEVVAGRSLKPYLVFRAMIKDGHGHDLRTSHNIVKGLGEPGLVDVPLAETVARAHDAGAVAIVAHPGRDDGWGILNQEDLDRMRAEIPIDGIEAHYRSYNEADTRKYREWASERGLMVSAGSDSHWPNFPVNPTHHPARWVAGLLETLGHPVADFEGPAWVPPEPAAVTSSSG